MATVASSGASGLKTLIKSWMTDASTQPYFQAKMLTFFRNAFQQTGFVPTEDFKAQLLENGGFDFGPVGYRGDDAFARIVQNLRDSIALTAWQTISEGRPLTDLLTTQRFMMTTALKSLYLQIEMPNDQPYSFAVSSANKLAWKIEYSSRDIPLTDTLNPSSPDYMVFSDIPPVTTVQNFLTPTCQNDGTQRSFSGYAQLFQRLLGFTPRYPFAGNPNCWEHPSKPYNTDSDLTDWQWVTITPLASGQSLIKPYDLPTLRTTTTLPLQLPRVGFYTTPAFLALWNTNDSNQHRVTANQTLLVALGQSFTPDNLLVPFSAAGLDSQHAVTGTECYGCHKNLDPMRQFWATQYDFNDRNDFLTRTSTAGCRTHGQAPVACFAFDNVNQSGSDITGLGSILMQVIDQSDPNQPISRFAISMAQKLCYYANSSECVESDAEFRRVALAFANDNFALREPGRGALLLAARDRGRGHRDLRQRRRHHQRVAARSPLRGAVQPARARRHLRAAGSAADHRADGDTEDRRQRRRRRLQPRLADSGDALEGHAVLPGGDRDAVRERRHAGGRRQQRQRLHQLGRALPSRAWSRT